MDQLPPPPQPKPVNYKAALITLLCAFLLGGASCAGWVSTFNLNGMNRDSSLNSIFGVLFGLCVAAFVGSLLYLILSAITSSLRR